MLTPQKIDRESEAERVARLRKKEGLRLANEAAIAGIEKRYADSDHLCKFPPCREAGSMSRSVRGSVSWYCREHFEDF